MLAWSYLYFIVFQIYSLCILLFCKFLMYFIVFIISYVFHLIFINFKILDIVQMALKTELTLFQCIIRKSVISMCFVHKHKSCKMRILGKFCADVRVQNVTWSRDRWSNFRKLGIKRSERKNSWRGVSRSAAVARQSQISYRPPPPPPQLR